MITIFSKMIRNPEKLLQSLLTIANSSFCGYTVLFVYDLVENPEDRFAGEALI